MLFKKKNHLAEKIYQNIVKISRSKFFYLELDLEDSFETRFDLIILHAFIIFYFFKTNSNSKSEISQNLFDHMFADFENNLRELGFGDIAVNKKMKIFVRAFYGRLAQYSKSIELLRNKGDNSLLQKTLLNNIYKGSNINKEKTLWFVNYMEENLNNFINLSEAENINNNFQFLNFKVQF